MGRARNDRIGVQGGTAPEAVMTPELRPYQQQVIADFNDIIRSGTRRTLLVAPTGSGKTVIAGQIVRDYIDQGKSILF